jgi:dolichyl-phosphate-mannose-protein mannosyltransferase
MSEGVEDHDIFLLPASDYRVLGLVTILAAFLRLYRASNPAEVVFDGAQPSPPPVPPARPH